MDAPEQLELQDDLVVEKRRWPLGDGSVEIKPGVKLVVAGGRCTAWVAGQPVLSFEMRDAECRNFAMAQLHLNGHGTQDQLAAAFAVHSNTVYNSVKAFRDLGFGGLTHGESGPLGPHKVTAEIRALIIREFLKNPGLTLEALESRVLAVAPGKASLTSIRRVLNENGFVTSKTRRRTTEDPSLPGLFDQPTDSVPQDLKGQLLLPFDSELPDENGVQEVAVSACLNAAATASPTTNRPFLSRSPRTPADESFLGRLQQEVYSDNGGGLVYAPFLSEAGIQEILKDQFVGEETTESGFSPEQMWLHLWNTVAFGYPTVEASKHAKREHLGVLIGENCSPGLTTTRTFLNEAAKKHIARPLMQAMARSWFDDGRIAFGVFYIDEHFLPYYGVKKLDEGWFSSHKKIQKGSYQYFVTDEAHNPVFFLLTDANERLVQLVPRVMDELKQTAGDSSKGKKMTLVFDRGGCSVPLFRQVTEAGAHFITYVENSDELGFPSEKIVWAEATLQFKKKSRVYRISDCCGTYRNFPRARIIGVWNLKTGKRTFVVSSDHDRPANEIANLMLGRWGQENFIKVMKHDLHIDHFPGYDYLGYKDREVNNPEHIRLRNEKAALTTQIKQAKQKLAEAQLKNPSQTRTREKKAVELQELCAKVTDLLEEKKALSRQQRALSAKIPLSQTPDAQRMSRLDFERKAIVDVLKLTVYMAWRSLEKKLAPHYRRNDIHQVVKMIASRGASLRLENDTLHCQLKHFDQPSVHRATEALCGELNQLKAHTPDKWRFKIQFSVSPRPTGRNSGLRLSRGS